MPTLSSEDLCLMGLDDAKRYLSSVLPRGWSCRFDVDGPWHVSILLKEGVEVSAHRALDAKLSVLDALGEVLTLGHPTDIRWVTRGAARPSIGPAKVVPPVPDPPDLDPEVVLSVYSSRRT